MPKRQVTIGPHNRQNAQAAEEEEDKPQPAIKEAPETPTTRDPTIIDDAHLEGEQQLANTLVEEPTCVVTAKPMEPTRSNTRVPK